LVSRKPVTAYPSVEWIKADLKSLTETLAATKGATVIYMCAGLQYNKKIWSVEWPLIMDNLLAVAKETGARLIFFDNVYMYGRVNGPMTEETLYNPASVKGEIRARIARKLMEESNSGNINATIARAADFYGAESLNSFFDTMVLQKFSRKEKAMWLGNADSLHSFTYVPDAGKAMYLLGQRPSSGNQVWHVPTAKAMTGKAFIELAANIFHIDPRYFEVRKLMLQAFGLMNPLIRETVEMYYQYQFDYVFDSTKFENTFGIRPTSYESGIRSLFENVWQHYGKNPV
jgi:nucleoside-diphosphate-sugar epimerase